MRRPIQTNVTRFIKYREPQPPAAHEIYNSLVRSGDISFIDNGIKSSQIGVSGSTGFILSSQPRAFNPKHIFFLGFTATAVYTSGTDQRSFGFSLRCLAS